MQIWIWQPIWHLSSNFLMQVYIWRALFHHKQCPHKNFGIKSLLKVLSILLALFTKVIDHFHANFVIKCFLKVLSILLALFTKVIPYFHANFVIKCFLNVLSILLALFTKVIDYFHANDKMFSWFFYKSDRPFSRVLELQKNDVVALLNSTTPS